ncbi:hypothetical protein D3C80_1865290 [compost metagenome]
MEQPRTDAPLQFLDSRRNGGAWDTKRIAGAGEARALDDTREDAEQVDAVQEP